VLDLQSQTAGTIGLSLELMQFLKRWLSEHILESDKRFAPFLRVGMR
jgi:hemerythrin